jgi:23S rRNA (pseudouridine1915-N3)-methyltransferase
MNFNIISCSHHGFDWARDAISLYEKRIQRFATLTHLPCRRHKLTSKLHKQEVMKLDTIAILNKIPKQSQVYVCDAEGTHYTSETFSKLIDKTALHSPSITFIIGPAYGLSPEILQKFQLISLSKMTLQHEMAHMVLYEQIYRALTILNNHPYHR